MMKFVSSMQSNSIVTRLTKISKYNATQIQDQRPPYDKKKHSLYTKKIEELLSQREQRVTKFLDQFKNKIHDQNITRITQMGVKDLQYQILKHGLTCYDVTLAFLYKSAMLALKKNYIADINFDTALKEAEQLDTLPLSLKKDKKLLGIPIAIKDHMQVAGYECTVGMASRIGDIPKQDCSYVKALKQEGAIILCMTTVPQYLSGTHCVSNIWGEAINYHSSNHQLGGSSGGSAGIIASGCAPVSIGTDLIGSIKIPSAWNGIFGFKPTPDRSSIKGVRAISRDGTDCSQYRDYPVVAGPMGRCVDDLIQVKNAVFNNFDNDPIKNVGNLDMMLIHSFQKKKKIRIGYVNDDPEFSIVGQNQNAIRDCIQAFKESEYFELVKFQFHQHWNIDKIGFKYLNATRNYDSIYDDLGGQKPIVSIKMPTQEKDYQKIVEAPELFNNIIRELDEETEKFWTVWNDMELDAMICPVESYFIPRIGQYNLGDAPSYSRVTNLLRMPSLVMPVRISSFSDEKLPKSPRLTKLQQEIEITSKNCRDLPVGIQILAQPFRDQVCFNIGLYLENKFQNL